MKYLCFSSFFYFIFLKEYLIVAITLFYLVNHSGRKFILVEMKIRWGGLIIDIFLKH
jgi:hypothetical protein